MSSKGKRSSILKKQQKLPSTDGRVSPVASLPSALFKSNRKIEFHRKKSIKEFLVGEDVDTIWGNSYEVSTDGTPSSGFEDATLANSTCRSTPDEQNKENLSVNQHSTVDNSVRRNSINTTNTSWDLSITIADEERRKIRGETSVVFSQSLNTTERLLVEPFATPQVPTEKVKPPLNGLQVDNNDVQAMDISPIKPNINPSPRKLIYTFPKQGMFVEINDVPDGNPAEQNVKNASLSTAQRENQKTPIHPSWRTGTSTTSSQSALLGGSSYNVSETWNSHPHGAHGDLANVSSDVDTTIALTNAMTKVLQSRSNESIQKATNMELDESTTTLPTNALARARPSFLPSNQHPADESQDVLERTPINGKQESSTFLPAGHTCEDTQSADISSPVEGHIQRNSLSLDNLSILTDTKEENTNKIGLVHQQLKVDESSAECKREGIPIDFGLSSLSLNLRPSSPEIPVVVKPRILRPTLPLSMLETAKDVDESKKTDTKDEYDRNRSAKRTLGMVSSQRQKVTCEDLKETEVGSKKSLVAMDISTRRHTNKPSLATVHSRTTVDMVESSKQSKDYRSTIYHSYDIDIDREVLQGQNSAKQRHRQTVLCDAEMDLTTHVSAVVKSSNNATRRTNLVPEPLQDDTAQIQRTSERNKRETVLGAIPIDDSTDCSPHSPETALKNYRKTVYPLDRMKEDVPVVPPTNDSDRKTIICNDSMVVDVYPAMNARAGPESSISCVVYGRNVDELSIHAAHGNNAVDMKFGRPTTFQPEQCDESAQIVSDRETLMQEENMIVSEGATSAKDRRQRFTTHIAHSMEEDEKSTVNREKKNGTTPSLYHSRKSIFNAEEMELTLVKESNTTALPETFQKIGYSTQTAGGMDEGNTQHLLSVRMEADDHADQEGMDLHKTHREDDKAYFIQSRPQSRIPRLTSHLQEDMQDIQREVNRPRYSIYEREDMDVSKLDCGTTINEAYPEDRSNAKLEEDKKKNSSIHPMGQHKSRFSIYEHEAMNATNICEDPRIESQFHYPDQEPKSKQDGDKSITVRETHSTNARIGLIDMEIEQRVIQTEPKESAHRKDVTTLTHIGCADLDDEMQNNVTNYNTFLEHHETSHGMQVQQVHHTDQLHLEKAFNSTRLSKAYEKDIVSKSVIPSRPSSYLVEAMDETNAPYYASSSNARQTNFSERKTFSNTRLDSSMHMSPVDDNSGKSTLRQNARQSSYYPEEMESTPTTGQKKALAGRKTCIESFSLRKSELQRIAQQGNAFDMEGISVLESDPTDSKLEKYVTVQTQATSCSSKELDGNMIKSVVATMETQPKGLPSSRLSVYDAAAMVEETVPINALRLKQGQIPALDRYEGVTSKERKSNDCMDETIVPENIRVERDLKYDIHQSSSRVGSTGNASPLMCIAEHPSIIGQHQAHDRGTLYGTEEIMELTTASRKLTESVQDKRNRQTIHQPANMDLTTVGRETVTAPPQQVFSQRETIYNVGAMEETPPHGGFHSVKATNTNKQCLPEPGQRSVIAERPYRRPRQTILIPQDMDVEDEKEERPGEEQKSFALSMLPRETTEDRVPRSASILPKHTFFRDPSMDAYPEFTKSFPQMERQSLQTVDRKTIPRNDTSAFKAHEISDISLATTTMEPEVPCIGNITGMMSMREITEPLPLASFQEQSNSVSVICRADGPRSEAPFEKRQKDLHDDTVSVEAMAFVPTRQNGASDDEFYDAEDDPAVEHDLLVDPLSLTKSRHLTMKFIDVGHLEQTNYNITAPVQGPVTACKRAHAQVLSSPVINRATVVDQDPLHMTTERQTLHMNVEHTPQGPIKKRPRTSCTNPAPVDISTEVAAAAAAAAKGIEEPSPIEEVIVKEERETLTNASRISQTLIHDPSVFVMEEQNLLDDESDLPCTSMTEELQPDNNEQTSPKQCTKPPPSSTSPPPVCMIMELSYYKNFANLTIDTFDSYEEEPLTPSPGGVGEMEEQADAPEVNDLVAECISVSDEDSLIVTPPKVPFSLAYKGDNQQTDVVLDSTIASNIMYQIRQKHPVVKHSCCGMQTECLCRMRKELKRHREMSDLVWNRWCTKFEAIKQRIPKVSHEEQQTDQQRDDENRSVRVTLEEQIEELNWRLLRAKVDDDYLFVKGELSREDLSRRRSRTIVSGQYPETPSAVFLADNFRSCLSEQLYVDNSPPLGAPRPRVPRITQLIANKLSTDTGTRWLLDCSEDGDGVLLLRHRTLRSFYISVQLQPPRSKTGKMVRDITESWRLERIQVHECMEEYVHSPKLLLAHIEFMRLAQETTERTLRSTYRTVADLMGLWHHFHELMQRVFDAVNRLVTIIRNNEALLCYDAQMERFHVKKCVYRALDDEVNTLLVHFNWIASIGASGVSFKRSTVDLNKLLPTSTGANQQHTTAPGNFMQGVGTNEKTGLMFLECLLWNVAKHYET